MVRVRLGDLRGLIREALLLEAAMDPSEKRVAEMVVNGLKGFRGKGGRRFDEALDKAIEKVTKSYTRADSIWSGSGMLKNTHPVGVAYSLVLTLKRGFAELAQTLPQEFKKSDDPKLGVLDIVDLRMNVTEFTRRVQKPFYEPGKDEHVTGVTYDALSDMFKFQNVVSAVYGFEVGKLKASLDALKAVGVPSIPKGPPPKPPEEKRTGEGPASSEKKPEEVAGGSKNVGQSPPVVPGVKKGTEKPAGPPPSSASRTSSVSSPTATKATTGTKPTGPGTIVQKGVTPDQVAAFKKLKDDMAKSSGVESPKVAQVLGALKAANKLKET